MDKTNTRQAGRQLEQQRIRQKKIRENRKRVLMKKSQMLLVLYLNYINPVTQTTRDQQLKAFYQLQENSLTDLQIILRIDVYENQLAGGRGVDPAKFCEYF